MIIFQYTSMMMRGRGLGERPLASATHAKRSGSAVEKKAPLKRNITTKDVGDTAAWLLSGMANGVTGQTIYVDSGYSIMGL